MAKQDRPRRHRRLQEPAPQGQSGPYEEGGGASTFSLLHVNAESWERGLRTADNWLTKGASLLRAASILHDAHLAQPSEAPVHRAMISEQIIFLSALALENALKGIIMARTNLTGPLTGKFPEDINGHSLTLLAQTAEFEPIDAVEADALEHGEDYIEWIGRYPSGLRPETVAAGRSLAPTPLFTAYRAMFHRAVEAATREVVSRGHAPRTFSADKWIDKQRKHYFELTRAK